MFEFFEEGKAVFQARWEGANAAGGGVEGSILQRSLDGFLQPFGLGCQMMIGFVCVSRGFVSGDFFRNAFQVFGFSFNLQLSTTGLGSFL